MRYYRVSKSIQEANDSSGGSNPSRCNSFLACLIAFARMILTAIYQMLSTGEQWNPCDLYKIDMPVALVEKQKAKAIK